MMTIETPSAVSEGCVVCLLTSAGRGAVATIGIEGREAARLISSRFQPLGKRDRSSLLVGDLVVGHWQSTDAAGEEVVVCRMDDFRFEVNCHGGDAAGQAILRSLIEAGATQLTAQQWLETRELDAIQVAATLALTSAATSRAAAILLDQYRGALSRVLEKVIEDLSRQPPLLDEARMQVERLIETSNLGLHLTKPWRVVVAGAPNVGKSSLVNALLGYERAIVFDQPGTTRDVLSGCTAIDGWAIELIDTAGLRTSPNEIEASGIERARAQLGTCDLVLLVTAANAGEAQRQEVDASEVSAEKVLHVLSKCDLGCGPVAKGDFVRTSAVTGEGLELLMEVIVERLVGVPPPAGVAVPFTLEQAASLRSVLAALLQCRTEDAIETCGRIVARLSGFDP